MNARLILLNQAYTKLSATQKASPLGQTLLNETQLLNAAILAQEKDLGRAQKNVGNYTSAITTGASKAFGAIRQIANILPGLGIAGIFAILFEQISKVASSVLNAIRPFKELKEANEALNTTMSSSKYTDVVAEVKTLKTEIQLAKDGFIDKDEVVKKYNETIGETTGQVNNLREAEEALNKNAEAYIRFTLLKAAATEVQQRAAKELVDAEIQNKKDLERIAKVGKENKPVDKEDSGLVEFIKRGEENLRTSEQAAAKKRISGLENIAEKFLKEAAELSKKFNFNFFSDDGKDDGKLSEQLRKDALELFKYRQGLLIEEQKAISTLTGAALKIRIDARNKQTELEKELINRVADFELSKAKQTADEKALIQEKRKTDLINASSQGEVGVLQIRVTTEAAINAEIEKLQAEFHERELKATEEAEKEKQRIKTRQIDTLASDVERDLRFAEDKYTAELVALSKSFEQGKIKKEGYEKEKLRIENEAIAESIRIQIAYYRALILISDLPADKQKEAIKKLHDLEIQSAKLGIKTVQDKADKEIEIEKKKNEALKQLATELSGLTFDLFTAGIDRQKNAIQDQIDALEARKQKEIEVQNQITQSTTDRANNIAIIEARTAAQREQLELRQRKLQQERARFEKAQSIASILQSTAIAVVGALGAKPWTPANIALAAIVGALGAAQIARVLVTPIPKYFRGKNVGNTDSYEGPAWVDDGGKPELIVREDGSMEVGSNKPRLTFVGSKDQVYPDAKEELIKRSMINSKGALVDYKTIVIQNNQNDKLDMTMRHGFKMLNNTIKNKRETHIHIQRPIRKWISNGQSSQEFLDSL
jgi:hypothetical protein